MQTNGDNERAPGPTWWQYAAVALVLVVGFFLMSLAGDRGAPAARLTQADVSRIYAGDWNTKVYFFMRYAAAVGGAVPGSLRHLLPSPLEEALKQYRSAATRPIPAAVRRAGVLTYELRGRGAVPILDRLDWPAVLRDLPERDKRELRTEARMWIDIYAGTFTAREVDEYAARIRRVGLGPVQAFALKHLYTRAGRDDIALKVMQDAQDRAPLSVIPALLLGLLRLVAGIVGIVLIALFVRNRRRWLGGRPPEETTVDDAQAPAVRETIDPRVLFQGFVVYIGAIWMLSIIFALTLVPELQELPAEVRLLYLVALEFGVNATSGMIGLGALYNLTRRAGESLQAIGLSLRGLGANVLWGIAGYCALLPVLMVATLVWNGLMHLFLRGVETPVHPLFPMLLRGDPTVFMLLFLIGTVLAPFFEEIFFRGVLYGGLRAKLAIWPAVLISAAAFAIIHPQLPAGFLPILSIGMVFAVLLEARQSLVPSMVAHALNNGVILLTIYFAFIL